MGRPGRVTTIVGPQAERLVADLLSATAAGETLSGVFSRKRSLRRSQKKRVVALEAAEIDAMQTKT